MKLEPIENSLSETILGGFSSRGLRVLVNPRPEFVGTFGALGTNFGSVDRVGNGQGQVIPEGLAHFLEHKLFEDQMGDVSDRFSALGASTNAMTGFSGTTYIFSSMNEVSACLELLLSFVQTPWFTDELVQKEQGIIAQEIRMYDDDPDWRIFFGLLRCLYASHPVRDNIAGSVESIAEIDAATLHRCYKLFYHPRNMCLSLSGALDPEVVAEVVERDQATRPLDELAPHVRTNPEEELLPTSDRHEEELSVSRPRLLLGVKETVLGGGPLEVARRQLCSRIVLDALFGRASDAYQSLYSDGLVDESFSASYSGEPSFGFSTLGGDTDEPDQLEDRLRETLAKARHEGLGVAALERVRRKIHGMILRSLDSTENIAFGMLSEHFHGLKPFAALELVEQLTVEELDNRLREHFREDAFAVSLVRPCGS
ncbi:MAG: pitrilysin family protein [Planctomycetota bacterium]|nr:pitrilysin family protein [Planctomycetota bacterium]